MYRQIKNDHDITKSDHVLEFVDFMLARIIKDDKKTNKKNNLEITHTLMGPLHAELHQYRGKFHIKDEDYPELIKLYTQAIKRTQLHIIERPKIVGPMVIDIDFKIPITYKERQYLVEHIEYIIEQYNKLFKKYLNIDEKQLISFVFEKPSQTFNKDEYKDGFHILYPEIALHVDKRYFFFDKVKEITIDDEAFNNIPHFNDYDDILDNSVIMHNGMLLYGSNKEGRDPYSLTKAYVYNKQNIYEPISIDKYAKKDLISYFSIRKFNLDDDTEFKKKYKHEIIEYIENKEQIKDIKKKKKTNEVMNNEKRKKKEYIENEFNSINNSISKTNDIINDRDKKLIIDLVKILSDERADKYNLWIQVCWTLNSISSDLFYIFDEFSKRSSKYDKQSCINFWEKSNVNNYGFTIASLHWWARTDNLRKYNNIMREHMVDLVKRVEAGTHDDIANILVDKYKYFFKCVSFKNGTYWYQFQGHRWVPVEMGYTLRNIISDEIAKDYMLSKKKNMLNEDVQDDFNYDEQLKNLNRMGKIQAKLKTEDFISNVVRACSRKLYFPKFPKELNNNPDLLGFTNGVYDLKLGVFRDGMPDDKISMTVGYEYKEFNKNDRLVKEVIDYFEKVQPEDDMRNYVLRLMASFLSGRTEDQKFVIWTGEGCHIKDTKIKMFIGESKTVQDIKLNDKLLGADGRPRRVCKIYNGFMNMYDVKTEEGISFKITPNHRLALKCFYKPEIKHEYNTISEQDIYWLIYHEFIDETVVETMVKFNNKKKAENALIKLKSKEYVIQYGEIIPVPVCEYASYGDLMKNYKLVKYTHGVHYAQNECFDFTITYINDEFEFYGFELDGDKKYVMDNDYITYNSNGKSTTISLIHKLLGDYSGVFPKEVITKKTDSAGAATPHLADKPGKRFIVIQEPEVTDTIYVGKMKELVAGNDKIFARGLYCDPFEYVPVFKLILICNKLPSIPSDDGGTWRRIRVTPWEMRFVDNPNPEKKNEFKKIDGFEEKLETWKQACMWLLLKYYYPKYILPPSEGGGLCEPKKVTKYTDKYRENSDLYAEFISEFIIPAENKDDCEKIQVIYQHFKNWYKISYAEKAPPSKDLKNYFEKKYEDKFVKNILYGYKIKEPDVF